MTDEEVWCDSRRAEVIDYLGRQGMAYGGVGEWPAWHLQPYASVWAVESMKAPGSVGWWVIAGDLPTDYCSAEGCRHPRLALRAIAQSWRRALTATAPGDKTIGQTGLPAALATLLTVRSQLMLELAADDTIWTTSRSTASI